MGEGQRRRPFADRRDAGCALAELLGHYAGRPDLIVLGLPRGGVPVAFEVAQMLHAPLDVFMVRKLGVPGHEELAMGAIATGNVRVLNPNVVNALRIPASVIDRVAATEERELTRREREYRCNRPVPEIRGKTVILVDDGLATGSTMRAAVLALRQQEPRRLVVAVPVAARQACNEFRDEVDEIVCAVTPEPFWAVGSWYEDFSPTSDAEVRVLLQQNTASAAGRGHSEGNDDGIPLRRASGGR
jgi:putative phosphoribosyl transferase